MNINELSANLQEATHSFLKILRANAARVQAIANQPNIKFAKPCLTRLAPNGEYEPVLYKRTIATISGQTGLHKSNLSITIAASFLTSENKNNELLGFMRDSDDYVVVLLDTERNLDDQLPFAIQQIRRLAGFEATQDVKNFLYTSLLNVPRNERLQAMTEYFEYVRTLFKDEHIILLIDVVSDLAENFNDVKSSMPLLDKLNEMINLYNCTVLALIHQNPSNFSDKSRGHLGSELDNKSSTIITLAKKNDNFICSCKKQRSAKPFTPFGIRYNADKHCLEEDFAIDAASLSAPVYISWELVFESDKALPPKELYSRMKKIYDYEETASRRYVREAVDKKELTANGSTKNRTYSLVIDTDAQPLF